MSADLKNWVGEIRTSEDELYQENILDHYKHPHHKQVMVDYSCRHRELNPLCGDELTVYLRVVKDKITEISFQGQGCAISQAAMSMLTEELIGKFVKEALSFSADEMLALLGIKISHTRIKCALLGLKGVQAALQDNARREVKKEIKKRS